MAIIAKVDLFALEQSDIECSIERKKRIIIIDDEGGWKISTNLIKFDLDDGIAYFKVRPQDWKAMIFLHVNRYATILTSDYKNVPGERLRSYQDAIDYDRGENPRIEVVLTGARQLHLKPSKMRAKRGNPIRQMREYKKDTENLSFSVGEPVDPEMAAPTHQQLINKEVRKMSAEMNKKEEAQQAAAKAAEQAQAEQTIHEKAEEAAQAAKAAVGAKEDGINWAKWIGVGVAVSGLAVAGFFGYKKIFGDSTSPSETLEDQL